MSIGRQERLAKRYAKALFDVTDPASFDSVTEQLKALAAAWEASVEFRNALMNPIVSEAQRANVLDLVTESLGGWRTPSLKKVVHALVQLRKAGILPSIATLFEHYVREYRKSLALTVTFSAPPRHEQVVELQAKLCAALGGQIAITAEHDPALLGGLTIRLGDRLLDRSVAGTLTRLADQIRR